MRRLTYEFVKNQFEKEGYELLSGKYINCKQKLVYRCPNGHEHSISWSGWKKGRRCPYCFNDKRRLSIEFIKNEFTKEGYKLLDERYVNANTKLNYTCPNGHKHSITYAHWYSGERCPYCSGNIMPNFNFIKESFKIENYKLLSNECEHAQFKLNYVCPNGHKHFISWNNWQKGERCPYCSTNHSKGEIELRNFVESMGIKTSPNNRNQIFNPETGNGLELDVFMPDFNKAIECNGEYWHQNKNRDLLKQKLCKSNNIGLLVIWEDEWKEKRNFCENKIKEFIFNEGGF